MTEIILESPDDQDLSKFIYELIEKIQDYFINNLDSKQLQRIDKYLLSKDNVVKSNFARKKTSKPSCRDILIGAIKNLTFNKSNSTYRIFVNPNVNVMGTRTSFEKLLSLIDKGNLEIPPYTIWSDTVAHFCNIIPDLYRHYIEEDTHVYPTI